MAIKRYLVADSRFVGGRKDRVLRVMHVATLKAARPVALAALVAISAPVFGETHPPVPAFSSRPGAAYTLYLDLGGFSFNGTWNGQGTPGVTPAYTIDGDATTFSSTELTFIKEIWARVAEKYVAFNINVTTVDPAVAAGQAGTDAARQAYYDSQAQMIHTVVGGSGGWTGGGGVSFLGVAANPTNNGIHTNWMFSGQSPTDRRFVAEATAHELGHTLGLWHQSDYSGNTLTQEYSSNGTVRNGSYAGDGTYAPTMGLTYYTQRGLWRTGTADTNGSKAVQNDYAVIGANPNMTLMDDGIGHSTASATPMPLTGTAVNPGAAKGFITPTTLNNPSAIGANNYTKDYFSFFSLGTSFTLTAFDGSENITTGAADPGMTLDSTLKIYNTAGAVVATGVRAGNTLSETISMSLPTGTYYVEVASIGGYTSSFDPTATYFTAGSYFLTGTNLRTKFNLAGANLSNLNLSSQDFSSASFLSTNFTSSNLSSSNFTSATLTSATLIGTTVVGVNFTGAIGLTAAQLYSTASYQAHNLAGISLSQLDVTALNMTSQNLTGASFATLNLTLSDFTLANLTSANLTSTTLTSVVFTSATIAGANFGGSSGLTPGQLYSTASYQLHNLAGITLVVTDPVGLDLGSQTLTGASFAGATFNSTNFASANLTSANLMSANLTAANFNSANMAAAKLHSANLTSATAVSANLTSAALNSANLTNANLASATLTGATFTGATVTGTNFSNTTGSGFTSAQLATTASFVARNLTGINLSLNTLTNWNLATMNLTGAGFASAVLSGTSFNSSNLTGANFDGATAIGINFGFTTLTSGSLVGANLSSAAFAFSSATFSNFSSANLTGASLFGTNLTSANLTSANLTNANFNTTNLTGATLLGANLTNATGLGFSFAQLASTASYQAHNLAGINFTQDFLSEWDLSGQNLTSANFTLAGLSSAILTGANFTGATLAGADLTGATSFGFTSAQLYSSGSYGALNLAGTNFSANDMTGWNLASQNLSSAFLIASNLTSANLASANLQSANLFSGVLTGANLSGANLKQANLSSAQAVGASFAGANLGTANLATANLSSANLISATLTGATLTSADLTLADVRGAVGFVAPGTAVTRGLIRNSGSLLTFTFNSGETLRVRASNVTATASGSITGPAIGSATVSIDAGALLNMSGTAQAGQNVKVLNGVALALQGTAGQRATIRATTVTATASARTLLPTLSVVSSISITNDGSPVGSTSYYGLMDLGTNDAIFRNGSLAFLADMARAFVATSGAQGLGSGSTIPNTRVAVVDNVTSMDGVAYYSTFDGVAVSTTDVLARFTYIGDTNLDGVLNAVDFSNVIEGLSTGGTGWRLGDFNYDGTVNSVDFTAFTTAYNAYQLNPVSLGSPGGEGGGSGGSVPEPGVVGVLAVAPLLGRRRR